MSMVHRHDLTAISSDGRYILEARSPYNAPDGAEPETDSDQSPCDTKAIALLMGVASWDFRYQLLDATTRRIVWERSRISGEPCQLAVSDDGWAVIWMDGARVELLAIRPSGNTALRVRLLPAEIPEGWHDGLIDRVWQCVSRLQGNTWVSCDIHITTAGVSIPQDCWSCFFASGGQTYLGWRTVTDLLVVNLNRARVLSAVQMADPSLQALLAAQEQADVRRLLAEVSPSMASDEANRSRGPWDPPSDLRRKLWCVPFAFHLVGLHRMADCASTLRSWQQLDDYREPVTAALLRLSQ